MGSNVRKPTEAHTKCSGRPYTPGLLAFRELPATLAALEKLDATPDLLVCGGQGLAHPRRIDLDTACAWTLALTPKYRQHETTRQADHLCRTLLRDNL